MASELLLLPFSKYYNAAKLEVMVAQLLCGHIKYLRSKCMYPTDHDLQELRTGIIVICMTEQF